MKKDPMRREPLQLAFWTPRELHLIQPGRKAAAEREAQADLRRRTTATLRREVSEDPYWAAKAYNDFWDGKEWG